MCRAPSGERVAARLPSGSVQDSVIGFVATPLFKTDSAGGGANFDVGGAHAPHARSAGCLLSTFPAVRPVSRSAAGERTSRIVVRIGLRLPAAPQTAAPQGMHPPRSEPSPEERHNETRGRGTRRQGPHAAVTHTDIRCDNTIIPSFGREPARSSPLHLRRGRGRPDRHGRCRLRPKVQARAPPRATEATMTPQRHGRGRRPAARDARRTPMAIGAMGEVLAPHLCDGTHAFRHGCGAPSAYPSCRQWSSVPSSLGARHPLPLRESPRGLRMSVPVGQCECVRIGTEGFAGPAHTQPRHMLYTTNQNNVHSSAIMYSSS